MTSDDEEHAYVVGRVQITTDITCPRCHYEFDVNGDLDGQTVVCPSCKLNMTVRKDDGA